jgi:hypothetical protein
MAVKDRLRVRGHQVTAGAIFASGIPAEENDVEVATVGGRVCETYSASEHHPPKPKVRREPCEGVGEQAVKGGKADVDVLIKAPAPTRSFTKGMERDPGPVDALEALLRHRHQYLAAGWSAPFHATRHCAPSSLGQRTDCFYRVKAGAIMWKRCGSGKPQQSAANWARRSLSERHRRQAAADRSSCSRLTSRRSPVRAGHRP